MALLLELEARGQRVRFHVQGAFEPRLEPEWEGSTIRALREAWEIPGARFLSTEADFWDRWQAFLGLFRQGDPGLRVRLLEVPLRGAEREVWRLGPPTHEDLRLEHLSAHADPHLPQGTWRHLAGVTLLLSGVQRFADVEGVTGWAQEVRNHYDPSGLQVLEWRTEIHTKEGVNALERARRLGRIDVRPFGERYSYDTNGPEGVDLVTPEADERSGRVPTHAIATSRIRQWGVRIGVSGPGEGPTEVSLSRRRVQTPEGVVTSVRATALGPHAKRWVLRHAPSQASSSEVVEEEARRYAEGTWTVKRPTGTSGGKLDVRTELSGGRAGIDFLVASGGYPPVRFEGGLLPWRLQVRLRVEADDAADLRLPQLLPPPWELDPAGSTESEPHQEGGRWIREATLLYWSRRRPTHSPREVLLSGPRQLAPYALAARP